MKYASILLAILVVTTTASADIWLDWTPQDLGDGLTQYTFQIRNDDGLMASYAATVAFETYGDATIINQEEVMGQGANDEPTANFLTGFGFDKARDTFSLESFIASGSIPGNSLLFGDTFNGYREDTTYFEFSVGTGPGSPLCDYAMLAQVVADGDVHWIGTIARGMDLYTVEGWTPEPCSVALMLFGGLALLKRRQK